MEIAFVSSNKIYLEIEKKQDDFISKILTKLTEKPSKFIATMLVGNNIAMVVYGFFMGDLLMNWFRNLGYHFTDLSNLLLQTSISTLIVLITSEFLPKVFFQIYANSFIKIFALPAYFFYKLFYYFSSTLLGISDYVLKKFFKTEGDFVPLFFSKVELGNYISEQMNHFEDHDNVDSEIQIFQNALDFSSVKARECMIPRTEIIALDVNSSIQDLKQKFIQTRLSKILIYSENIDNIIGYVYSKELFKQPESIKSILLPVSIVPESMAANEVLTIFIQQHKSIAIVVDEYGGTSGMITMEDIMEEIFGEIEDEHDKEELIEKVMADDEFVFSARLETDYINHKYNLNLPILENFETIGGLIMHYNESIPEVNEEIKIDNFLFTIRMVSKTRIETVSIKLLPVEN
jgi:CBS domain containing-hemolysin-like protein